MTQDTTTPAAAPCQVAMSGKVPREAASSPRKAAPGVPNLPQPQDLGKALGKLLGR